MIPVSDEVVENAKQCLEILNDDFELNMRVYNDYGVDMVPEGDVCDTSFCLAGWQAYKDGYPEEYRGYRYGDEELSYFEYYRYSLNKVKDCDIWSFFYDGRWCNDKEYARKRMQFIIDNKVIPYNLGGEFFIFPWKLEEQ